MTWNEQANQTDAKTSHEASPQGFPQGYIIKNLSGNSLVSVTIRFVVIQEVKEKS
jgi:hypothetical protein